MKNSYTNLDEMHENKGKDRESISPLLDIINSKSNLPELIHSVIKFLKEWSGMDAIGIRLKEGDDYPYFETSGFTDEFVKQESHLCIRDINSQLSGDKIGNCVLECMCGNIISGRFDPSKPFFTPHGSFWTNSTTELLASTSETDRLGRTRNRCNGEGYESVALIPLRSGEETFGLLQLNDRRKNLFTLDMIEFLEKLGDSVAIALAERKARESLQINEEKYRLLYEQFPLAYQSLDSEGHFIEVNKIWLETLGYKKEDVIGKWLGDFLTPNQRATFRERFADFKVSGELHTEFEMLRADGAIVIMAIHGKIGYDINGLFKQTYCILNDITLRKKTEEAIKVKDELLRLTGELAKVGGWEFDTETSKGTWTDQVAIIHDLDPSQETNVELGLSFYSGESRDKIENSVKEAIKNAKPYDLQLEMVTAAGNHKWVRTIGYPVISDGKVIKVRGIFQDITEQKLAGEALKESEEHYRSLFENMLEGFAFCKMLFKNNEPYDFIYLEVNDSFEKLTGLKNVVGKKVSEVVPGILESDPELIKIYGRVSLTRKPERFEFYLISLNNWFSVSVYSPKEEFFVAVFDNITHRKKQEVSLRKSEEQYRLLFETMAQGVFYQQSDGKLIIANNAALEMFGLTLSELQDLKSGYSQWKMTDEEGKILQADEHPSMVALKTGKEIRNTVISIYNPKDNDVRWLVVNAIPQFRQNETKPYQVFVTLHDITKRKQIEEEIKNIAKFPDENLYPVMRIAQNGQITYANKASSVVLNYWKCKVNEKAPDNINKEISNILNSGKNKEIDLNVAERVFTVGMVPIIESGYVNLYFRDITARKNAEEKLHQHVNQYNTILTTSLDGFCLSDMNGKIIDVNDRLCELLGYSREELRSMFIRDIEDVGIENEDEYNKHWSSIIEKGFGRFETRNVRKDGKLIDVEVSVNYIADDKRFLSFFRDLTDKKKLEAQFRQSQKMESIGRLAGGVAHDFNNILTVIMSNAEMAQLSVTDDNPVKEEISEIEKAAERAANLTRQLLAFSRKQIIKPKVIDMNNLIMDMNKMFRRLIGENIELITDLCQTPCFVKADPGQIEQVITNLVINARDALPEGGKIIIETKKIYFDEAFTKKSVDFRQGNYVMVVITDNGIGMSDEVLFHVFEPFFTTKEKGKGTGLGLSTCYGIIKQNNGNIDIYSQKGKGTVVKFYLPAIDNVPEEKNNDKISVREKGYNKTVLIVEDETSLREVTAKFLKSDGYDVMEASNGEEALKKVSENRGRIDLVITDVIMPVMGGKELSVKLKENFPEIKLIFMSGYADNSIVHEGVLDSGVSFIQKPFSHNVLADKIKEVLGK